MDGRMGGRKEQWMKGGVGARRGEGQRRVTSDNYAIRTCIQNATSLATYIRNLS